MIAQLLYDFSICAERRLASRPRRSEIQTISGASSSSCVVELENAKAAAGSIPVHSPTKYVVEKDFVSITSSLFSSRLCEKEAIR